MRKEVQLVVETGLRIEILTVNHTKGGKFEIREHFSFDKSFVDIGTFDSIKKITLENYADQENLIVIHMASNQIKVFSESIEIQMIEYANNVKAAQEDDDSESDEEEKLRIQSIRVERNRPCNRIKGIFRPPPPVPEYTRKPSKKQVEAATAGDTASETKNQTLSAIRNFFTNSVKKNFFKVDSYFMRRQFIFFKGENGEIKRIQISDIKNHDVTLKTSTISYPLQVAMLKDVTLHVNIFNDFLLANTTLIISHQKVLSIYDFLTGTWRHMLPQEQGNRDQEMNQTYFGMPADEIDSLLLNYVFSNSIYDCIIKYRGKFIRRLKYYNDLDK